MLTQEITVTIKILRKQGKSIKGIAKELGVSKNTVRKYLKPDSQPTYSSRPQRASKLDSFKPYLQERIAAAHPNWIPATVLFDELVERGYTGKIRILRSYLADYKPTKPEDPVVRFETLPGKQMQVDFTTIRRGKSPLKAFVATLGYSRATYVRFFDHERSEAWIEGMIGAFEFFGGVPIDLLFDNAKAILIERDVYGQGLHRWNNQLLALAEGYGFNPKVCRPYRAQTKGKVERFNRYLKDSFVTPLVASLKTAGLTLDVATANAYIGPWLTQKANQRLHATTKAIPNERLIEEQKILLPLPIRDGKSTQVLSADRHQGWPMPFESVQHALATYDQLLEADHEPAI